MRRAGLRERRHDRSYQVKTGRLPALWHQPPRLATDHPAERFTESMLAKLQADPVLTVELIDGVDTEPAKAKPGAKPTSAKPAAKPATQAKG